MTGRQIAHRQISFPLFHRQPNLTMQIIPVPTIQASGIGIAEEFEALKACGSGRTYTASLSQGR